MYNFKTDYVFLNVFNLYVCISWPVVYIVA